MTIAYMTLTKPDLLTGLDQARSDYKIAALTQKGERVLYDYVADSSDILFGCSPTVLPPKKFFFPQEEVILEYTADGKVAPKIEVEPLVLFGIRPCDLHALKILDEAFADTHGDPNYLSKRERAIIVGMDCKAPCDQDAFCYKVGSHHADTGFDLMLYSVGESFAVAVATERGRAFVEQYFHAEKADETVVEGFMRDKQAGFAGKKAFEQLSDLPEVFEKNKEHPVWEEEGKRCLSCGSCIMCCPTCYCFDVADELALNLKRGERVRRWDACMLNPFAKVAGNENFRESAAARLQHRIQRKFNYLMRKHKQSVCVGCGRCVRACLAKISPKSIVESLTGEEQS